jgi:uncharacterized membrane protein YkvA (DUF1232 family)
VSWWQLALLSLAVLVGVWAAAVVALVALGRASDARALARFIPDCLVLFRRLLADQRLPRRRKVILLGLLGYLALPFDLIPDFVPVAGQLDDAIIVALALRFVLRSSGEPLVREHWPGPAESLAVLTRFAFGNR